jgi:hypothetical protein
MQELSNFDVGDGKPTPAALEVMLPIQTGKLEMETEILRVKEEGAELLGDRICEISRVKFERPGANSEQDARFQENETRGSLGGVTAGILRSEAVAQKGGPWPGCLQEDQRPCQSELSLKAIGASLGKTMTLRTLSISKTTEIEKIWEEVERRLGASRSNFSLVRSISRYIPLEGHLDDPEPLFEIRWRGKGGGLQTVKAIAIHGECIEEFRTRVDLEEHAGEFLEGLGLPTENIAEIDFGKFNGSPLKCMLYQMMDKTPEGWKPIIRYRDTSDCGTDDDQNEEEDWRGAILGGARRSRTGGRRTSDSRDKQENPILDVREGRENIEGILG